MKNRHEPKLIFGFLEGFLRLLIGLSRFPMSFFGQKLVENWFFCQKNLNPDFAATTVTKIQANQTMHCLFKKKKLD
jgi:hypothetical protein